MEEINFDYADIKRDEPPIKLRKPRRTKIPEEKEHIVYLKSYEQKESSKRQKNTQNWETQYGIYIDPTNQEDYFWFKQNSCLVRKLLPIINKVNALQIPFNERE